MSKVQKFISAQENVYGDISDLNAETAPSWVPPPSSGGHKGRYLWTDAFGVLNFLTLYHETSLPEYLVLAQRLTETVHDTLGRTRDGKSRLPGATDSYPLGGGLRIGKVDEGGSDGDGQYHHYLTLWMFSLNRLSIASSNPSYNDMAISLAKSIHPNFFIDRDSSRPRIVWKIAMDMSRPLVASQGHLDPIDGYVILNLLQDTAREKGYGDVLAEQIADYKRVMEVSLIAERGFSSSDTLDLGMGLWTAHWFHGREEWADDMRRSCVECLTSVLDASSYSRKSMVQRLAFRDFGAVLGAKCATDDEGLLNRVGDVLEMWERVMSEDVSTPEDLKPINFVMYAAALIPGSFKRGGLRG